MSEGAWLEFKWPRLGGHHLTEHHPLPLDRANGRRGKWLERGGRVEQWREGGSAGAATPFEIRNSYANFHTFIFHTLGKQRRELKMIKRLQFFFFISWLVSCLAHFLLPPPGPPLCAYSLFSTHTHTHTHTDRDTSTVTGYAPWSQAPAPSRLVPPLPAFNVIMQINSFRGL